MAYVVGIAGEFRLAAFTLAWVLVALWGVERLWPRGNRPSPSEAMRASLYLAIFTVSASIVIGVWTVAVAGFEPLFPIEGYLGGHWSIYLIGPLFYLVAYDFFNYWMHRAQHRWFWRQHRIHHAITNLSALNSYFHPTEPLFRLMAIYAPLTLLFGWQAAGMTAAVAMVTTIHAYYVHSPTIFNFGRGGRWVFVDNAFHRIHHSVETQHFDKNFGAFTTLWDRLFGTAHFPARGEWPEVGVWDYPEAKTVSAFLLSPPLMVRCLGERRT